MNIGAKERALRFRNKSDGTYDTTGKRIEYKSGYQFSFVRKEAFKKLSGGTWDMLTAHIMNLTGSAEHIGVFEGEAETSFRVETGETAMRFERLFNQQSILDWEAKANGAGYEKYLIRNDKFDENKELDYDSVIKEIL